MKKIAVMTYHDMINYGSFFQMYSLQQFLKNSGFYVSIVNYKKNINFMKRAINNNYKFKKIWLLLHNDKLWLGFNEYYNIYINKTKIVSSDKDFRNLNEKFDFFIAGSDQIWTPNQFDIHYYLDYVRDNKKMIAYAPSVVIDTFTKTQIKQVKKHLFRFKNISVREKKSYDILKKNFSIEPLIVMDPTFIVEKDELDRIIPKNKRINKYKIISYFIGENVDYNKKMEKIMGDFEAINNICIDKKFSMECANNLFNVDPGEFLYYISNCETVMTDSYHGIVLAIKYKKKFIVFNRFNEDDPLNQNSRITDLLKLLEIKNVNYNDYIEKKYNTINYNSVEKKLNSLIKKSQNYLLSALGGEKNEKK